MQFSDVVSEHTISKVTQSVGFDFDGVNAVLDQIECELGDFRRALEKRGLKDFRQELFVEARYEGQVWELDAPLPCDRFRQESDVDELVEAFHMVHERVFAVRDEGSNLECVNWKGRITARLNSESEQADLVTERPAGNHSRADKSILETRTRYRHQFFEEGTWQEEPRCAGLPS